ncbi:Cyclic di-GMP phosphodiesterase response regulator RpfG [Gemmata obscuriglobus]|uniref:protein kinase domain-containing protein n=1 Tax=Gemmata obscuriglobus TaxID=114 RepID=UPI000AC8FA5F|nr:protein kinase [Gemmata obscuriglobus]QEG32730.1 Cyclic di-GMP phosphodiesterase response regulator RpfG [Gemmata obscuriglobus]
MGTSVFPRSVAALLPPMRDTDPTALLRELLASGVVANESYEALDAADRFAVDHAPSAAALLDQLVRTRLLTEFQAARVRTGRLHGLTLGNYRLLDRIGTGGMGVVYRAEHRQLRTVVAVKVLQPSPEVNPRMLARFFLEARAVGQLKHPNIVAAIDAGEEPARGPDVPALPYFVMEFLAGADLERVAAAAPLSVGFACQIAHQIADALIEAHRLKLVHRDIKPSNVLVTPDGQAKLLDFGLARLPGEERITRTGAQLGTVGYMAPEQARNAHDVDARADVFGLGCTLYFALTGQAPFSSVTAAFGPTPSARALRPEVPAGLDAVVSRMMAAEPAQRYPTAEAAMRALLAFLPASAGALPARAQGPLTPPPGGARASADSGPCATTHTSPGRVLIVDDQIDIRRLCRVALGAEGLQCEEVGNGPDAVALACQKAYDLVLLDVDLPGFSGEEVLRRLRQRQPTRHLKVVMFSGAASGDELSRIMLAGADDFLTKPFSVVQLRARVKAALRLKDAQDRADVLNRELLTVNAELEQALEARDGELLRARNGLVLALAKLVEHRSAESGRHLQRLQRYCRALAEGAAALPAYAPQIDATFIRVLEDAVPLHDIGKAALPDHILNKPGRLDEGERTLMEAHTTIGADTLREVARQHPFATGFLHVAIDIARGHHERWDGSGYPDRLSGEGIPLVARLVAFADVYDAMRSRLVYKPALSHHTAVLVITEKSEGQFDPGLREAFLQAAPQFDRIFRELGD